VYPVLLSGGKVKLHEEVDKNPLRAAVSYKIFVFDRAH
jgi:hypothetical protein